MPQAENPYCDKGKSGESPRRKAAGPRFLRHAFCDATKDFKIAGLPVRALSSDFRSDRVKKNEWMVIPTVSQTLRNNSRVRGRSSP